MRNGLFNTAKKMLGADAAVECMLQLEAFRRRDGCFGSERALAMASRMPAHQWWDAHADEAEAKELKFVARKVSMQQHMQDVSCWTAMMSIVSEEACYWLQVLSMVASAGGCERNWSTYDFITNRKRNKLDPRRAADLVYLHYNSRCVLKSREPEQFASWLDEDVQLLPVENE